MEADQETQVDEVLLVLPSTPEFLRLARVTASGLASRMGFTVDDVEDLRLATDELCFALTGAPAPEGTVELRYRLLGTSLEVEGLGRFNGAASLPLTLTDFSERILDALVDDHELSAIDGMPRFRLLKHRST
jgi:anti-sigma regulatory factor (Ser/Thr protein kinase)